MLFRVQDSGICSLEKALSGLRHTEGLSTGLKDGAIRLWRGEWLFDKRRLEGKAAPNRLSRAAINAAAFKAEQISLTGETGDSHMRQISSSRVFANSQGTAYTFFI